LRRRFGALRSATNFGGSSGSPAHSTIATLSQLSVGPKGLRRSQHNKHRRKTVLSQLAVCRSNELAAQSTHATELQPSSDSNDPVAYTPSPTHKSSMGDSTEKDCSFRRVQKRTDSTGGKHQRRLLRSDAQQTPLTSFSRMTGSAADA